MRTSFARFIITLLFILSSAPLSAATLLVWGDSLSAGYGLKAEEAWPALLQTRLREAGFPHRVVNASVSGETTAGGRTRLAEALTRHRPQIVILELGANDGLRGLPPKAMHDNLAAMIEATRKQGAAVLLVGMQLPPNYGRPYREAFAGVFATLAREHALPFVPFLFEGFAANPIAFQADGIHPRAEFQDDMLDLVWPQLQPLLKAR